MLDIIMLAVLAACCGSIALLIYWCQKQVDQEEQKGDNFMIYVLGGIVILMGGYLVYALVHPEKF